MKGTRLGLYAALALWACVGCPLGLAAESRERVSDLQSELSSIRSEITAAQAENDKYSGGLIKSLIATRVEILKTNEALVQQRISAIEGGAPVRVQAPVSTPDTAMANSLAEEIKEQNEKLSAAQTEAARYSGGLVQAMSLSTAATQAQTLAMLEQRYLIAKYGLAYPMPASAASAPTSTSSTATSAKSERAQGPQDQIILVTIESKHLSTGSYQKMLSFDLKFHANGLDKPTRAIKGVLHLNDLFGESKLGINWTLDKPLQPGETFEEADAGFEYNQFIDRHQWANTTSVENMRASFTVTSILYEDGTRKDF